MKKILFILLAFTGLTSCGNNRNANAQSSTKATQKNVIKVIYFHGKQRCITCNAIEKLTKWGGASVAGLGKFYNRMQVFQKWMNKIIALLFMGNQSEAASENTPLAPAVQIQEQPSGCCPQ